MVTVSNTLESKELVEYDSMEFETEKELDSIEDNFAEVSSVFGTSQNLSNVRSLLNCAGSVDKLSAHEEKALVKRAQNGDKQSRDNLVMANLKMIASISNRYKNRGLPKIDLMQEGIIGLLRCIDKFDLEKGIRFSTYAAWWVRESMTRSLSNKSRSVRIPVHLNEFMTKLRRVRAEQSLALGRKPTNEELALELGVKVEKIKKALALCLPVVSLDKPVSNNEGEDTTLIELTEDDQSKQPDEEADGDFVRDQVNDLLNGLSKREREVVRMRFGIGTKKERNLSEVSKELGLTRDQVGKASCKAMRKLRKKAKEQGLEAIIA